MALLTVSFRESETGVVHDVRQGFASLLSPIQAFGSAVAEPFQDGYDWFKSIGSAKKKAEELEQELDVLQGELIELEEQREQEERLLAVLELSESEEIDYPEGTEFIVARVIAKSPSQWQAWVLINKGTDDGLEVDMPVVGATPTVGESVMGKGLVGKIVQVDPHTARIQLIVDSQSKVSAKIQASRAEGSVHGSMQGRLSMEYVDRDLAVDAKRVVVTSGYGGVYPSGVPIGVVSSVGEETINIYKEIEIQPFVDFRVLEEVMVLLVVLPDPLATTTTTIAPAGDDSGAAGGGAGETATTVSGGR